MFPKCNCEKMMWFGVYMYFLFQQLFNDDDGQIAYDKSV